MCKTNEEKVFTSILIVQLDQMLSKYTQHSTEQYFTLLFIEFNYTH